MAPGLGFQVSNKYLFRQTLAMGRTSYLINIPVYPSLCDDHDQGLEIPWRLQSLESQILQLPSFQLVHQHLLRQTNVKGDRLC